MKGQLDVATPEEYIAVLEEPRRSEIAAIDRMIRETVPHFEPHIRSGTLGYGTYMLKYAGGKEREWCRIAVASNQSYISLYCSVWDNQGRIAERYRGLLPKASIGKGCVRFKSVTDLDEAILRELIRETASCEWDS